MSKMKQQLETLAARVNDGDIEITDSLLDLVAIHNIRQDTEKCWCWTDQNGKATCGGIGALAEFINNDCKMVPHLIHRNHVRLAINGTPIWTTANGG